MEREMREIKRKRSLEGVKETKERKKMKRRRDEDRSEG